MLSKLLSGVSATLFAVAFGCLVLSAYSYLYATIAGEKALRNLRNEERRLPTHMSDAERSSFKESVGSATQSAGLNAGYAAIVGICLILALAAARFLVWCARRTVAKPAPEHKLIRHMVFWTTFLGFVALGVVQFHRHFSEMMPRPAEYILTKYRDLVALPRPGMTLFEQYLLETDPDHEPPSPSDPAKLAALDRLKTDPDGLSVESVRLLIPRVVLKSNVGVADLVVGTDGVTLYVLDARTGRLSAVDLGKGQVLPKAAVLSPATGGMCISHDGKTIYATSSIGQLYVVSSRDLEIQHIAHLRFVAFDVTSHKSGVLLISGIQPSPGYDASIEGLLAFDPRLRSRLGLIELGSRCGALTYDRDTDLLYISPYPDCFALRTDTTLAALSSNSPFRGEDVYDSMTLHDQKAYGRFCISPDRKYAVFTGRTQKEGFAEDGFVLKIKPVPEVSRVAALPAHHAVAWDLTRNIAFIGFTEGGRGRYRSPHELVGRLSIYSLPEWKQLKTYQLPRPAYQLLWDIPRKQLVVALDEDKDLEPVDFRDGDSLFSLGGNVDNPKRSLELFRTSNRVSGPNEGPLCVFDLSDEIK